MPGYVMKCFVETNHGQCLPNKNKHANHFALLAVPHG